MRGGETEGGARSGDGAPGKVGRSVGNSDDVDEEVLVREVGGVGSNKETGRSADGDGKAGVVLGVLRRRAESEASASSANVLEL